MKCKVFIGSIGSEIEKEINKFLSVPSSLGAPNIQFVTQSSDGTFTTITVFYKY